MKGFAGRMAIRVIAVTLAALVLAGGLGTLRALAWTPTPSGCPGAVQNPVTQGAYIPGTPPFSVVSFPQRFAYRTTCSSGYTQTMYAVYRMWKWNSSIGAWDLYLSKTVGPVSAAPGMQGATLPGWGSAVGNRYIHVDITVFWYVGSTQIGNVFLNYNSVGDYSCSMCTVSSGSAVGAYMTMW
jgi:hypothetical protein